MRIYRLICGFPSIPRNELVNDDSAQDCASRHGTYRASNKESMELEGNFDDDDHFEASRTN